MSVSVETIFTLAWIINFRKFGLEKRKETVTETTGRESDRGELTDWSACKLTSVNSDESLKLQVRFVSASFKLYNKLKTQREIRSFSKESLILRTLVNYSLH